MTPADHDHLGRSIPSTGSVSAPTTLGAAATLGTTAPMAPFTSVIGGRVARSPGAGRSPTGAARSRAVVSASYAWAMPRIRRSLVVLIPPLLGAGLLLAACAPDPVSSPEDGSSKGTATMTTDVDDSTTADRADWDLSVPRTPRELGGRFADIATVETLGRDGVEVHLTLPGGDVVTGSFGLVTGDSGGGGGPVRYVGLATTHLHDGEWNERIDEFVAQFGGDRQAVADYLATALPAMQAGEVDPGQHFPGDARPEYEPVLQIRPDENGVVVVWKFNLPEA
jgi:hypothetical protein